MVSRFFNSVSFYADILRKHIPLYSAKIKNTLLAKNLEYACDRNGGFLTYAEYFDIVQYGEYGYQAKARKKGQTDVSKNWAPALAVLCKQHTIRHVVEFGAGNGTLGMELLGKYKELDTGTLFWTAVEREKSLQKIIKEALMKKKLREANIVSSIKDVKIKGKTLLLFPYSLDSIGPEIFINTREKKDFPNAMVGISMKDRVLHEVLITKEMLRMRNITLNGGIYIDGKQNTFDLRLWKLLPGQRAYIPIHALTLLKEYICFFPSDTHLVIIDEFRQSPYPWDLKHLCLPRDFYHKNRDCLPIHTYYQKAGENYIYIPMYVQSMFLFLHALGFRSITYDLEQKMAHHILGKQWVGLKRAYYTYAFLASRREGEMRKIFPVDYPKRTIFL